MTNLSLIGIDLAKNVFQLCGISSSGKLIENKQLKRSALITHVSKLNPTIIAMEACYSSHYWAREFTKLGHQVKLLPAQHVKPFVIGNKVIETMR